ncbi:MAG: carbamoyl phosphate synthase large subunit, partial [Pseudomonadota bacterium]
GVFDCDKDGVRTPMMLVAGQMLLKLGLDIVATRGTAAWLTENEIGCEVVNKVYEGGLTIVDRLKDGHVGLVFNTTEGSQAVEDSRDIRAVALYDKIPYFTTAAASHAAVLAMQARVEGDVGVRALQG